jgi:hypothetical protein
MKDESKEEILKRNKIVNNQGDLLLINQANQIISDEL